MCLLLAYWSKPPTSICCFCFGLSYCLMISFWLLSHCLKKCVLRKIIFPFTADCAVRGWPQVMGWTHTSQICWKVVINQKVGLNRGWMVIGFRDFHFLGLSSAYAAISHEHKSDGSLLSFSGLCTINQLLSFLRFFCVQEDALVRLPAPTSPVGSAEGLQADEHLSPSGLSMG